MKPIISQEKLGGWWGKIGCFLVFLLVLQGSVLALEPSEAPAGMESPAILTPELEEPPLEEPPVPIASMGLGVSTNQIVQQISARSGINAAELVPHEFATFTVVEHPPSGRSWVVAKSASAVNMEPLQVASLNETMTPPSDAGAFEHISPNEGEIAVVEVTAEGLASQPTLLADQQQGTAPQTNSVPMIAGAEVPGDPGPAVIPSGFVQFGATYHSNVFYTDEGVDYDLVRHPDTDTGNGDVVFGPAIGLRLDLNPRLAESTYFEFISAADFFNDESGENRWRHSLEFASRGESGELLDLWWRGGVIFHDQLKQDEAEYLSQDFMEFWVNPGLDFFLTERDTFTLGTLLFYRNVSKDGLPDKTLGPPPEPGGGELPPAEGGIAPKTDIERYADHVGFGVDGTWRRRFSECLETRLRVSYLRRQYDRPALDEYGAMYGCDDVNCDKEVYPDRQDDLFETSLGYTYAFCPETAIGMAYRFRHNGSNGDFYDYNEHGIRVVGNHTIFHGRWCEANLRLIGDVAWRNWGSRKADEWDALLLPPVPGPDGILTPGIDEDTREDLTYIARVGFDREFGGYTIGTFYQFEVNNSNDGSGDYKDHSVGGFIRYEY